MKKPLLEIINAIRRAGYTDKSYIKQLIGIVLASQDVQVDGLEYHEDMRTFSLHGPVKQVEVEMRFKVRLKQPTKNPKVKKG